MARVSNEERLEDLFQTHQARLFRLALRLCRDREDARDLVQETFVRAARHVRSLPPEDGAEGWLVRTMVNLGRDRWRRQEVRDRKMIENPNPGTPNPERSAVARLTVRAALQTLSPKRRAVVALVELEGLTSREAGRLLGLRPATVRWHRAKALAQLSKLIKSGGEEAQ